MSELTLKSNTLAQTAWATDKTSIRNITLAVLGGAGRRCGGTLAERGRDGNPLMKLLPC